MVENQNKLLTVSQFVNALGGRLSRRTVYKQLKANNIRHFRTNTAQGRFAIPENEVADYPRRQIEKFS